MIYCGSLDYSLIFPYTVLLNSQSSGSPSHTLTHRKTCRKNPKKYKIKNNNSSCIYNGFKLEKRQMDNMNIRRRSKTNMCLYVQ